MAEETITILRVDASQATTTLRELRENISRLKQDLQGLSMGTSEYETALRQLTYNQNLLRGAMNAFSGDAGKAAVSMEDLADAANGAGESYNALVNRMSAMRKVLRNIDVSTEAGQKQFDELAVKINTVNTRLKEMDAATGNYQRNVGNYEGAVRGLNLAMAQVMRELPALTMGADMFFLAISNNLPILADNIRAVREQNKKLLAETGKAPKLFGQVVKSLFSWNSLMSIGITLVTAFGGKIIEWVSGLFKAKEETDAAAKAQEELNKAMQDMAKSEVEATASAKTYYSIATDVTRSMEDRLGAAQKLINEYPKYLEDFSAEEIIAGKAADAYGRLKVSLVEAARAKAAMQKITENQSKILDLELQKEEKEAELKRWQDFQAKSNGTATIDPNTGMIIEYDSTKKIKDIENEITDLTAQIAALESANQSLQGKISVTSEYFEGQADALKKAADELEKLKKKTEEYLASELDKQTDEMLKELSEIPQVEEEDPFAGMEDRQESLQKALDFQLERLEAEREQQLRWNELKTEDERTRLENEYLINEEYNKKKHQLLEDFADQSPDAETAVNAQIEAADLAVQIEQDKYEKMQALRDKDEEQERKHWKNVGKIAQAGFGAISGVLDGVADALEANGDESAAAQERIKNIRIAAATIDTIGGAIGAFMQATQTIPPPWGQIVGAVQAAAVVATGIAQINKIRNTDVSGESGSANPSAPAAVPAPTVSTQFNQVRNITGASEEERLNRMAGDQRVYVLESDIEAAQNRRRVRVKESTF